jgi:hypothetical protein
VYVNGGVPVHVPLPAVSICPSSAVLVIAGSTVFAGGSGTTVALCAETALPLPALLVALIPTRIVVPTKVGVSPNVVPVAPVTFEQLPPDVLQDSHCGANVIGVNPLHVPSTAVRVLPSSAVPVIDGTTLLTGNSPAL